MKKLALLVALFSSLSTAGTLPSIAEEQTAAPAKPTPTIIDAKTLEDSVKTALADMKTFKDEKSGYTLDYPSSWQLKEYEAPMCFKVFAFEGGVNVNSAVEEIPTNATAQDYADAVKDFIAKKPEYHFKSISETKVKVAGVDAVQRVQEMGDAEFLGRQLAVYFVKNNKAYTFNGTTESKQFSLFEPVFQKMVDSIKLAN